MIPVPTTPRPHLANPCPTRSEFPAVVSSLVVALSAATRRCGGVNQDRTAYCFLGIALLARTDVHVFPCFLPYRMPTGGLCPVNFRTHQHGPSALDACLDHESHVVGCVSLGTRRPPTPFSKPTELVSRSTSTSPAWRCRFFLFFALLTDHHNLRLQQAPCNFLHHTRWEVDVSTRWAAYARECSKIIIPGHVLGLFLRKPHTSGRTFLVTPHITILPAISLISYSLPLLPSLDGPVLEPFVR